ncbi:MAG: hypothetical protein K8E24_003050 [Methanobacterium paludis]|nr:hypothetical protein [Methanobacterium paludis]
MQNTLNDYGVVKDPLEFGNCRYRFLDPKRVPKEQEYADSFEGAVCIYLGFPCDGKNSELLCGCWTPRNPKKGYFSWVGTDPLKKPKYGPMVVSKDWKPSGWDKLVAERIRKKGPGWWNK